MPTCTVYPGLFRIQSQHMERGMRRGGTDVFSGWAEGQRLACLRNRWHESNVCRVPDCCVWWSTERKAHTFCGVSPKPLLGVKLYPSASNGVRLQLLSCSEFSYFPLIIALQAGSENAGKSNCWIPIREKKMACDQWTRLTSFTARAGCSHLVGRPYLYTTFHNQF